MPTKWIINATKVGNPTVDNNGIVSGFTTSNYLTLPSSANQGTGSWTDVVCFTTDSDVTTVQQVLANTAAYWGYGAEIKNGNISIGLTNSTSSFNILNYSTAISANTKYWLKTVFTGSSYTCSLSTDGETWTTLTSVTSSATVLSGTRVYGVNDAYINPFKGSIDMKECYTSNSQGTWIGAYAKDVSGSVTVSKGFYNDGTYQIMLPDTTTYLSDLVLGQTYGCLNELYVTSYNGTATVRASNIHAPTGVYDVYIGLETPVYLSHSKNYIIGGSLKEADWSFENESYGSTNYSVVGSPTISSDYILSGISNSKYVTMTIPSLSSSFVCIAKHILPSSVSSSGSYPCSISVTSGNDGWGVGPGGAAFGPNLYLESAATSYGSGSFLNTKVWTYLKITTSNTRAYYLEDSTDQYTLDTLPDIDSGAWTLYAGYSSNMLSKVSNKTLAIGVNYYQSRSYSNWSFDLTGVRIICDGVVKTAKQHTLASISATPVVAYNSQIDDSYWIPTNTYLLFNDLKSNYTLSDRSGIYYYNSTGVDQDVSGIAVTSDPQTDLASCASYCDNNKSVYLNHTLNDTILGIGKYPDQVALTAISTSFTPNYTVTGSPTISSEAVASGFSTSNYLTATTAFPSSGTVTVLIKHSVDSSYSANQPILRHPTIDRGIYIQNASKKFAVYDGSARVSNTTATAGKTYWIKYIFNSSTLGSSLRVLEDAGYTEDTLPDNSSALWDLLGWTSSENSFGGILANIGKDNVNGTSFSCGSIYLKNLSYSQDGTEVWRAAEPGTTLDTITADSSHYWTNLQNATIDVQGVSAVAASNWEGNTSSTGYVLCGNNLLSLDSLTTFTDTGDKAYSGYTATFTDSTGATISSLTKTGTLCRAFRRNNGAGFGWVFIPEEYILDGETYEAGEANDVGLLEATLIPIRCYPSSQEYTYSKSAGGVTDESNNFYADIGFMYIEWRNV